MATTKKVKRYRVIVGKNAPVPIRYRNRTAYVIGEKKIGNRTRLLLDFGPRRANPLDVAPSHVTRV